MSFVVLYPDFNFLESLTFNQVMHSKLKKENIVIDMFRFLEVGDYIFTILDFILQNLNTNHVFVRHGNSF